MLKGLNVSAYISGNESTAFVNGSRMAYIYEMYGQQNLSSNPNQGAAVQLALWDLSLNDHDPTSFSLDTDGTYSSGDESIYSVSFNSSSIAAPVAALVNQYLQASIGSTMQGGWFNAALNGTGSNRGQSMPIPGPEESFGETQPVTIGGTVYQDTNGNGAFDSGEPGIAGVTLTLSGTNGQGTAITATTTTNANGAYSFTTDSNGNSLLPGTYQVAETLPSGYLAGTNAVGTVNGTADGTLLTGNKIGSIVMNSGQSGINYNFGDVKPVTISGTVYQDSNANGVLDTGESGIAGVTLTLSGTNGMGQAITATTTTAANGTYSFTTDSGGNSLRPGTYQVAETQPTGYLQGVNTIGTVNSTADGTLVPTDKIGSIVLTSNQNGINYNFGEVQPVTISGTVYYDTNANGVLNSSETGIAGVSLTLTGTNNLGQSITATTTTSATGTYSFSTDSSGNLLAPGTYQIAETQPSGYQQGTNSVGTAIGSAGSTTVSWTPNFQSALNSTDTSGAGLTPGYMHDLVNSNSDNIFKGGQSKDTSGISQWQWTLQAVQAKDDLADAFSTSYIDPTTGHKLLLVGADRYANNGDSTVGFWFFQNSVSVNANGTFSGVHSDGDVLLTVNFGGSGASAVQVYRWTGTDASGTLTAITPPAGSVYFYVNTSAVSVPWSFIDKTGFTSPQAGEYMMVGLDFSAAFGANEPRFSSFLTETRSSNSTSSTLSDLILGGFNAIATVSGSANGTLLSGNKIGSIVLTSNQNGVNYNFGEVLPVTIAGTVYEDKNNNGVLDSGESGISGATLSLSGTNILGQSVTATTTTAANGTYSFSTDSSGNKLEPGTYQVAETLPSGYLSGTNAVGTVNGTADGSLVTGNKIGSVVLTSSENGINYNFANVKPVTVSGTVYEDSNDNGVLNTGEPGIAGVTLTLSGTNDQGTAITATATTAAGGTYSFTTDTSGNLLRLGTYQIVETTPSGDIARAATVGTVNGTADGTAVSLTNIGSVVLTEGQSGINYYFGDIKAVSVSGTVYEDTNDNGALNTGEPGIAGVTLTLSGTNDQGTAITATATSAANGTYSFTTDSGGNLLRPGTYQLVETTPSGYIARAATLGTINGTANGTVGSVTKITSIVLTEGQSGINYNFGDIKPVTIGGTVYEDSNDNGVLNSGEPGIAGVTLTLSGTNDQGTAITATATTSAGGTYTFTADSGGNVLRPGTYQIAETLPSGYLVGTNAVGTVNGTADGTLLTGNKIGSIVVAESQSGINYNFANLKPVTIAGTVYEDTNDNGVLDSGEPGIAGVTLTLSGTNDQGTAITVTTTTAAGGTYSFSTDSGGNKLRPGTYQIAETLPSGYLAGTNAVGTVNGTADGTLLTGNKIGSVVMAESQSGINYNFADLKPVTIAGSVYEDKNDNGVLDSGEPGIAGVTLTLSGTNDQGTAITATATTAANGTYSFSTDSGGNKLRPGTYQIAETLPSGYLAGTNVVGTVSGTADGTLLTGNKIGSIVVAESQSGINYNFADLKPVTIAGTVYEDKNDNGVLDSGEPGIAGVTLTLSGTNDQGAAITATVTTAAGGTYSFSTDSGGNKLRPGTYQIAETLPSGYLAGTNAVGTVNGTADGTLLTGNKIGSVVIAESQSGINYNFADLKPVALSGTVFEDTNDNGVLNTGEPGIAGVTLTLSGTNDQGAAITATATTAANGTYSFSLDGNGNTLRPGTYQITETLPSGYLAGTNAVGTVNGTADGALLTGNKIGSVVMSESQSGINYNFADLKPVALSGIVYEDTNDNGVLDSGEPGIAGVTLTLSGTNDQGTAITVTTTTAAGGTYSFSTDSGGNALRPGTYQIAETLPSGYLAGTNAVGTVNGTADGTLLTGNKIGSVVMAESQSGINYNFADLKPVTFAGTVYEDTNANGALDSGEPGIAGVTLTLSGTNDHGTSITATTTTAAGGIYSFSTDNGGNSLRPGTYQIAETLPSGYLAKSNTVGTVNGSTDGTLLSGNKIGSIVTAEGQSGISYNFGNVKPVAISGTVYQDVNQNGVLDSGDSGIAGVTLTLSGTNDQGTAITATTTTNANGAYSFTTDSNGNALRLGTYQIAETQPSGYVAASNTVGTVNGSTDGTLLSGNKIGSIVVAEGQSGINYNFGQIKVVTVSGTVYEDANDNGVLDSGEPGIAGVTLTLTGTTTTGQPVTVTTTTAGNGTYSFTTDGNGNLLQPGTYQIAETQPSGYLQGSNTVGTVNGTADGTLVTTDKIGSIAVSQGQSGINYNFGEVKPDSLSGTVYEDINANGVLDSGDSGIAGVTLTLTGTNDQGTSITVTTTTAANGTYSFSTDSNGNSLRPGTYQIAETQPSGYLTGTNAVGTVNGSTDGTLLSGNKIGSVVMAEGQSGINYNFGNVKPVAISGTVYDDKNDDGVLDSGDTDVAGVTLTLSGTNDVGQSITATTTTNANGAYSFTTDSNGNVLAPGTYQISETTPSGYVAVAANVGTVNGTTDGTKASPSKLTSIGLGSGQSGINYNFGLNIPASVSGYVYVDYDRDGKFDNSDVGLAGQIVTLKGINVLGQSVTLTATTDANGYYIFADVIPVTYTLTLTPPGGIYNPEVANVGTVNGTTDGTANASNLEIDHVVLDSGNKGINYNFGVERPLE